MTVRLENTGSVKLAAFPSIDLADFRRRVVEDLASGARIAALFAHRTEKNGTELVAILAIGDTGDLTLHRAELDGAYASLTPVAPQAHWFERELAEESGVRVEGHPWLKPIRFTAPGSKPGVADYFRVEGEEVHEVAVGPVHAGVIEPGHFRFQCHGERVFHLEISLGYQHRGVERALGGGPGKRTIHYIETASGDTSIGHALAYSEAIETLARASVPARAEAIRAIALELERLANHVGDLGALAGDVAFLPTASYCGRLRGDFLNMTARICGSRLGRGLVRPGGVGFDIDAAMRDELLSALGNAEKDVTTAVNLLFDSPSAAARFEDTGPVSRETAIAIGLVGPAARACGLERDARFEFPTGLYRFSHIPLSTWHTGDVFARAYVRWLEIQRSIAFVREQLENLPESPVRAKIGPLDPESLAVALVEGWRGEICHVLMTDRDGKFARYKIVDPSFHNWFGLAMALRDQQISDFPLCNKSFNLSYCGHDL